MTGRRALAAAGLVGVAAGGALIGGVASGGEPARSAQAAGGLSVKNFSMSGMVIERTAAEGAADVVEIENKSGQPLAITVKARPWTQSSSGAVSPNRRRELAQVSISESQFTLARGEAKQVTATLRSATPGYGALEIVGLPTDVAKRKGVVAGYRIVNSLRYNPPTRTHRLRPGSVKLVGPKAARRVALTVRNTGNTADPVTGNVSLRGALGTRSTSVRSTRILPGKSVSLTLWSQKLPAGSYTVRVTLTQAKRNTTITKKIRVR